MPKKRAYGHDKGPPGTDIWVRFPQVFVDCLGMFDHLFQCESGIAAQRLQVANICFFGGPRDIGLRQFGQVRVHHFIVCRRSNFFAPQNEEESVKQEKLLELPLEKSCVNHLIPLKIRENYNFLDFERLNSSHQ